MEYQARVLETEAAVSSAKFKGIPKPSAVKVK